MYNFHYTCLGSYEIDYKIVSFKGQLKSNTWTKVRICFKQYNVSYTQIFGLQFKMVDYEKKDTCYLILNFKIIMKCIYSTHRIGLCTTL